MKTLINFILFMLLTLNCSYASTVATRQYNFVDDKNNGIPITASRMDAEFDNAITKLNQKAIIAASAPSSPIAGMLWYDSTNKLLKQYRNSEWVAYGAFHYGTSAPSTPQDGDLWYDSTNKLAKLYNGTSQNTLLSDNGTFTTLFSTGNLGIGTSTAATARLTVIGGNVGIGTLSPVTALAVNGTTTATSFSSTGGFLGTAVSKTSGTIYQAATDGFVVAYASSSGVNLALVSDSSATPSTTVAVASHGGTTSTSTISFPVKKNNYYQITGGAATENFVPLGV